MINVNNSKLLIERVNITNAGRKNTRESIEVDVLVIGAGPAGLATAIN